MPVRSFEPLNPSTDVTTTRTFLHEVIPVTGSIISGTYGTWPNDDNIKNYTHGMFQSVYDYPYLSSSANHIFDLTVGYATVSAISASAITQNAKKINMYNEVAQVLQGLSGSSVRLFEPDLKLDQSGTLDTAFFVTFSRLLTKDQIKKNSFSITLGLGGWTTPFAETKVLQDALARVNDSNTNNTIGGDYAVLYDNSSGTGSGYGVVFYQAGIAVISASAFLGISDFSSGAVVGNYSVTQSFETASISGSCDALRHRIDNIAYNNTTEINSSIYFCRVPHNKFNYSTNPTYVSGSKIRVKEVASDPPVSYITTVGLYNAANELLAVAKLSEPLKKTPSDELIIRVRTDY